MPETVTQTDVPKSEVPRVEAGFKAEGATVETKEQADGLFTVIATFPDE